MTQMKLSLALDNSDQEQWEDGMQGSRATGKSLAL